MRKKNTDKKKKYLQIRKPIKADYPNLYPALWCENEKIYIGFSKKPLKRYMHGNQIKFKKNINSDNLKDYFMVWREGYKIDLSKFKNGDVVLCPKCKTPIEFRAFPSHTIPKLIND